MFPLFPKHSKKTDMSAMCRIKQRVTLYGQQPRRLKAFLFITLLTLSSLNVAQAVDVSFNGYMSLVAGKVLSGERTAPLAEGINCPCFISNWNTFATYDTDLSMRPESRAGIRMNAKINDLFSGVVQVDVRATEGSNGASLEWVYLNYVPANDWTLQLGRKRLPIYYYSDFMDIGFAYPWVRVPQALYGWEINNFNGISLAKTGRWDEWSTRSSIFYGKETSKSNPLASTFTYVTNVDVTWDKIMGADLELSRDWFNIRMVFIQSDVEVNSHDDGSLVDGGKQRIYGISANIDYQNWIMRTEFSKFDRWEDMGYQSKAGMIGIGYTINKYTPMVTYSGFRDEYMFDYYPYWEDRSVALSLRYDINPTSSFTIQYDEMFERSSVDSTSGDAKILSTSFDMIF